MEPKERKPFRWRTWHFALIFVLNILLVCTADCLLHFPITGSVYASPPEALHPRLKSSQIIQYDLIDNICAITFRDQQGTVCFLALEQYGPISRCRVLEDDAPPSLPWSYYIHGSAFAVTLNVKEDGSFQIEDVDDHARVITGRYFLLAGLLELVQILVYQILKKAAKKHEFLQNNP